MLRGANFRCDDHDLGVSVAYMRSGSSLLPLFVLVPLSSALLGLSCSSDPSSDGDDGDAGCSSDADCKGSRVCDTGVCVDYEPGAGPTTGSSTSTSGAGGGTSEPGAPEFLSFGTNVPALDGGADTPSVTFTAVVTDPDGVDDVIGGSLLDQSGAPYGAFATSGQEGAYEMTLTWEQINTVSAIDFDPGPGASRTFTAEFFDASGKKATRSISLSLTCDGSSACDGDCGLARCTTACVWLGSDQDCGACGNDCGSGWCNTDEAVPFCFGAENTNALCSDGLDNDGDGYFDCVDYNCSQNASVTVCP